MAETITIFDTTLRDGEQAAGAGLNWDEKLEIAKQLDRLGVDVIEAGFPASSPGNLATVQQILPQRFDLLIRVAIQNVFANGSPTRPERRHDGVGAE